jgi:hypothetical protein
MSLYEALIPAVASLGGAAIGAFANSGASKSYTKALKQANKLRAKALNQAQTIYEDQREQAEPAVQYLRDVVANPVGGLYPDQVAAQMEARRQALNDISRSGLRGSGRAVTAGLKSVDSDFVNDALAQNRQNRMGAAGALSGQSFQAGSNAARAMISGGDAAADTAENIGATQANTGTANAQLFGNALGDIGSLIASEVKGRPSSYEGEDIPGRSSSSPYTVGTVNHLTGQFGHLNKGGVVKKSRLHDVVSC